MDRATNNVIVFPRSGISREDADFIEIIMRLLTGEEALVEELEVTDESMESICRRMAAEPGAVQSESTGWCFPVPSDGDAAMPLIRRMAQYSAAIFFN